MLAHVFHNDKHDPTGYWMSEKLDGVRCVAKGGKLYTRTGRPIHAPAFFTKDLPPQTLDGEIYGNSCNFDAVSGICRRKIARDSDWRGLTYQIFDLVDAELPFEERQKKLWNIVPRHAHLKLLRQRRCRGSAHLESTLRRIENNGGEGVMLRQAKSHYAFKRSSALLKVKTFLDMDARVVGHEMATKGKHKRKLGTLLCNAEGVDFRCGSGLTDAQRANPPPIDSLITVKYFELTKNKKPRFPTYVGMRAEQDMRPC